MTAGAFADRVRGTLLPAVVTPMDERGTVAYDALEPYAEHIAGQAIGGVAVWAHTGRGLHLSGRDRMRVLRTWRQATSAPLVVGAGMPTDAQPGDVAGATVAMAEQAAEGGADAVMVYPPASWRDLPDRDHRTLELHRRVASASGLPTLAFLLHGGAGGYRYPVSLVRALMSVPGVAGIKTATLDRAIDCQDTIAAVAETGKLTITGEDRMFGPSLMWGADTALVGIAAARVDLSARVLSAWTEGDLTAFHDASARLDAFAAVTFLDPIEGYVQRMLWAAVGEGLLPQAAAHDPYGPPLPPSERDLLTAPDLVR